MKIINLLGGPSSGKSTTAAGLFYKMKLAKYKVELVTEYAKSLVYSERGNMFCQQDYIFAKQHHMLYRLKDKVDWLITDSPLILSIIYAGYNWRDKNIEKYFNFSEFVHSVNDEYDNYYFFLNRVKEYQKYGRNESEEEARKIDKEIIDLLDDAMYNYHVFDGDETAINRIVDKLNIKI